MSYALQLYYSDVVGVAGVAGVAAVVVVVFCCCRRCSSILMLDFHAPTVHVIAQFVFFSVAMIDVLASRASTCFLFLYRVRGSLIFLK